MDVDFGVRKPCAICRRSQRAYSSCAEAHQTRTSGERARAACADSSCSRKTRAGSEEQEVVMPACARQSRESYPHVHVAHGRSLEVDVPT